MIIAGLAALAPLPAVAEPDGFRGSRNIQFTVDFNFFTRETNSIVASGAFDDEGTIGHGTDEFFRGAVAKVVDSPEMGQGSFTWELNNVYVPTGGYAKPGVRPTYQTWKITGGTGKYEGMTGLGSGSGTWSDASGELHVVGFGTVDCPKC
ncbi:MAG TPA: hypothetical protein VM055_06510 [Novosphingobium sp.]|nr:hypothetical protein [Novosphingobium sp.]